MFQCVHKIVFSQSKFDENNKKESLHNLFGINSSYLKEYFNYIIIRKVKDYKSFIYTLHLLRNGKEWKHNNKIEILHLFIFFFKKIYIIN